MTIHVVRRGDTLYDIGELYNVDYQQIAEDNEIAVNQHLVVGQTLVIMTEEKIKPFREISVNGFAFTNINITMLNNIIEYLTYLSIFSYAFNPDGSLKTINDEELIAIAKNNGVLPVMVVTNIGDENKFNSDLAHTILNDESIQNTLIDNIINTMTSKGYEGLNIDFEYVYQEDEDAYMNFLRKVRDEIKKQDFILAVAVAPKYSDDQQGLLYEAHDYQRIGQIADLVILMTYEWGYSGGPAMAIAPIDSVMRVLDYAITRIPLNKILLGIPNYGYDWTLPYIEGTLATSVSNPGSVDIARNYYQSINYEYEDQAPYFNYHDENLIQHEVWFDDARSIKAKLELVLKYNLEGVSYWTINRPFPQNYHILKSLYTIKRV